MPAPADLSRSPVRRALMWWFGWPVNPYVSVSVAVDFSAGRDYLAALAAQDGPRVTVQHLVAAGVARTLHALPVANARIAGGRIVSDPHVGIAMPVNLLGHPAGDERELAMTIVPEAERLSLRDLALQTTRNVAEERQGKAENPVIRGLLRLARSAPTPIMNAGFDALHALTRTRIGADALHRAAPATTAVTNAGAAFRVQEGAFFRGGAVQIPGRVIHVTTLWGISAIQDEVIPIDGAPAVRPMLPGLMVFDHRIMDGVMAGRVLMHFSSILRDPAATFGRDGRAPGPS